MKRKRHTSEGIIKKLRQAPTPLAGVFAAEQKWVRRDVLPRVLEVGAQEGFGVQARERLGSARERVPPGGFSKLPLVMEEVFGAAVADWSAPGWRRPPTHLYVPASERVRRAGDTRVTARRERSGQWLLPDDVVVISLPERTDRRAQVRAALERDGVKFRFADGVRLTDGEIDPVEVSEVHLHTFKLIGGAAKFLRGTAGCRRAHLRCLEEAHARGLRSLLMLEDDAQFHDGWIARYAAALEELPRGWLQLYLSSSAGSGAELQRSAVAGRGRRRGRGNRLVRRRFQALSRSPRKPDAALFCEEQPLDQRPGHQSLCPTTGAGRAALCALRFASGTLMRAGAKLLCWKKKRET